MPNYRKYASGQVVSLVGTWMQRVAQDWLVLELSGGNPVALGIAAALQFGPTLLLSLWGGVLADRLDKRKLLIASQVVLGSLALILGFLDVTGLVTLWQVYLLCFLVGCAAAIETPVRQSFVVEMVGRDQLPNAVALNATTFNSARIVGPAVAGIAIAAIGTGWLFLLNGATFLATIFALTTMNVGALRRSEAVPRAKGQLREGIRYVRGRPDILLILALVFCVGTFGLNFYATLAIMARNEFGHGAESYGFLSMLLAVGTLTGAVVAARRAGQGTRPRMRLVVGAAMVFGLLETTVGLMPSYALFGAMLVPVGAAALTFTTASNSAIQLSIEPTMRGRVMAIYMLVFLGGTPVGGPLVGWLAAEFGGRAPIVLGGLASFVCAALCGLLYAHHTRRGRRVATSAETGASQEVKA